MTVDKEKRSLIDIVDSIEAKLDKIIADNNMNSNPTTLSVDEQIEVTAEFLSSPLISQSGRNSIIKALIRQVITELQPTPEQIKQLDKMLGKL